jgi:LytS/YehU family sensor histidine kinase
MYEKEKKTKFILFSSSAYFKRISIFIIARNAFNYLKLLNNIMHYIALIDGRFISSFIFNLKVDSEFDPCNIPLKFSVLSGVFYLHRKVNKRGLLEELVKCL